MKYQEFVDAVEHGEQSVQVAPGREYLEMIKSFANNGLGFNRKVRFQIKPGTDGTMFNVRDQEIGNDITGVKRYTFSIENWDSVYSWYLNEGYRVYLTEKPLEGVVSDNSGTDNEAPLADKEVQELIDFLRQYMKETVKASYTMRVQDIKDENIEAAAAILKEIDERKDSISVAGMNCLLDKLHFTIPRNIPDLKKAHVRKKSDFDRIYSQEVELFETLVQAVYQLRATNGIGVGAGKTVLDRYSMDMSRLSEDDEEYKMVMDRMGDTNKYVSRIFKVNNRLTDAQLDNFKKAHQLGEYAPKPFEFKSNQAKAINGMSLLFHGTGTANVFSIMTNGLLLLPEKFGIGTCGKMFGHGIYFAGLARKSLGYTDFTGSCWKDGTDSKAYMFMFDVAVGEPYDIYAEGKGTPDNYEELQSIHPGAGCTWAMAARTNNHSSLFNEEMIVYTDGSIKADSSIPDNAKMSQCSIRYLIELQAQD